MADRRITAADIARLADYARAPTYRRRADGVPEHHCCDCGQWLPAGTVNFRIVSRGAGVCLDSYCRPCHAQRLERVRAARSASKTAAGQAAPAAAAAPDPIPTAGEWRRLADPLELDRTCPGCGLTLPLAPECWPQRSDGGYARLCLDCTAELHRGAARRASLRARLPAAEVRHV